jgi:hypothetical protein
MSILPGPINHTGHVVPGVPPRPIADLGGDLREVRLDVGDDLVG